ncbi:MAG: hypothetical protein WB384_03005, partial [Candidatus Sulfotelmatobacter sp.]
GTTSREAKSAQRKLLIGIATRSPEREKQSRAFLLTKTYMDAGDSLGTRMWPQKAFKTRPYS